MSAAPTPHPTGASPVPGREGGLCAEVHATLDRLDGELDCLARASAPSPSELAEVMRALTRLVNRTQALRDKGAAIAARAEAPERVGARSTGQWLARVTSTDARAANRQARRAEAAGLAAPGLSLIEDEDEGGSLGSSGDDRVAAGLAPADTPVLSATGRAQLAGDLSPEQVDIITMSLASLQGSVTPEARAACELELIRIAANRSPRDLRRLAARVLERVGADEAEVDAHEDNQVEAEEDQAWERASFWIKDNDDGTMHGQFTVPSAAGVALKKILDAMSSPRRARAGSDEDDAEPVWFDPRLTWRERQLARQQRQGQDFATLIGHLPTGHLHDKTAATVLVTTRLSDLEGATGRVGSTDTGHRLSAGETRRIACGAGIVPVVLGTESQPLDLGRQVRYFTSTQRAALSATYDSCAADGCDIPVGWTETHHLRAWRDGGRTDLANAVPLCGQHHRWLDRGFEHRVRREGRRVIIELSRRRT